MNETNARCFCIDDVNGAAISYVNSERDFSLISDQTVATREFGIGLDRTINDCGFIAMHLLGYQQWRITNPNFAAKFAVNTVEPLQGFSFVCRDIDTRNAQDKRVPEITDCIERWKIFDSRQLRGLRGAHLLHQVPAVTCQLNFAPSWW